MSAQSVIQDVLESQSISHLRRLKLKDFCVEIEGTQHAQLVLVKEKGPNKQVLIAFQIQPDNIGRISLFATVTTDPKRPVGYETNLSPHAIERRIPLITSVISEVFEAANLH